MRQLSSCIIGTALCLICGASAPPTAVAQDPIHLALPADSAERLRILHLVNRIGYGARPGDVNRIAGMGIDRYLEQQLHPERIPDTLLQRRLDAFRILRRSRDDLLRILREERNARLAAQARGEDVRGRPNRLHALTGEFQQLAIVRATLSERQLYEVMVDFWSNHFNVFLGKGVERALMPSYVEETIRPHALGRFEDLLIATARSPAMLFYLDNTESVAPGALPPGLRRTPGQPPLDSAQRRVKARLPRGLNENYARELLELHTLGVDGGYTQADVIEVARIFTGWSVRLNQGGNMVFRTWAHDRGEKTVLGHRFPAGRGMDEGIELLRLLSRHPSTVRHVSTKLCMRFVSDQPPPGCIAAAAAAWERTDGALAAVVKAIITSPDFWHEAHRGAKIKTPLEFLVSALRALGAQPDTSRLPASLAGRLGQRMYFEPAPTGYPETRESWINAGALLARLQAAVALAGRRVTPPVVLDATIPLRARNEDGTPLPADRNTLVERVNRAVLSGTASEATLDVMRGQAAAARSDREARAVLIALALGSPEFQRQ